MPKRFIIIAPLLFAATVRGETLGYHEIRTNASGQIVPWVAAEPAESFDRAIGVVWRFWKNMEPCSNGIPYFFQHQVWKPEHDPRGLGGDQFAMALSSLQLVYAYTGDPSAKEMMVRIADYYLENGFSGETDAWPNLPYPYNLDLHSVRIDGDMRAGRGFLQPDKAASFGIEMLTLYEMTGTKRYLQAAVAIADTLTAKMTPGDATHSPWAFRVNARTGELPKIVEAPYSANWVGTLAADYTANWTGALRLFDELIRLREGQIAAYETTRQKLGTWLKTYPMRQNNWGPFFEDIVEYSDTEINADTMAWYILEHPEWDTNWRQDARAILDWSYATFGNKRWAQYGVTAIMEQTRYLVPGNSHTSRHASVELIYGEKTGNTAAKEEAIRELIWATYMVDFDGKNRYPNDDIWLTDGYADYLRHYLRAMAALPELAPSRQNHLLRSSSVIQQIDYEEDAVRYRTFSPASRERLRVTFPEVIVTVGGSALKKLNRMEDLQNEDGYFLETKEGAKGVLEVRHSQSAIVVIQRKSSR